jgi:cell division protein FtsZ
MPMPMPMPAPQPARASPGSIFRRMTGLVGGRAAEATQAAPAPAAVRTEPTLVEPVHAPQPRARVAQPEETGLDIPAFLRRQAN